MGSAFSTASPLLSIVRDGFLVQVAAWAIAAPLQTERFYDLTGSCTFLYLVSKSLMLNKDNLLTRNYVNSSMVYVWAMRLGSFLVQRIMHDGSDRRFDKVKTRPGKFLVYWLMQGLWCVLTALPVYLINTKSDAPAGAEHSTTQDFLGWGLWLSGFVLQVTADRQKSAFRSKPGNKESFITSGVWSWCQHPNYFGEMCMWVGLFASSSAQMEGVEYATVACPLFNIFLLRFVSGVPLLQHHAKKKWGDDPMWQAYHKHTNLLLPNPFSPFHPSKTK